ncbi:biopolymer transporter ExbD [bacterium]|nr:biopolymer transporter ExbD [bacterium]
MSKKKKPQNPDEFGLAAPTGAMADKKKDGVRPAANFTNIEHKKPSSNPDEKYKQMAWRGFEEEEEDDDPDVQFGRKMESEDDDMDMTPMVDVTFLLLIFFMVTASFTLQKSIEQPPSQTDDPSTNPIVETEDEDDYVEVIIDQTNTFYVTSRDSEEVEAPTVRDMRAKVSDAKNSLNAKRLIITAHTSSRHEKVVAAYDAAMAAQIERIEMRTTEEDF